MFAGVWNLDGRPLSRSIIDRVLAPLAPAPRGRSIWREGSVALALVPGPVGPEPAHPLAGSSGAVLSFDGRLHDRHALVAELGDVPEADELMSDAALVLAGYESWGEEVVDHLVGDFALALFDPRRQWLILARDHSGSRPLHYLRLPDTMVFASRVEALLAYPGARRIPNAAHLSRLVLGGAPQGDTSSTTPFDGIHSVPPGHVAVLTRGRFVSRRSLDPVVRTSVAAETPYAEQVASALTRAVEHRVPPGATAAVQLGEWGSESLLGAVLRAEGVTVVAIVPPRRAVPSAADWVIPLEHPRGPLLLHAEEEVAVVEGPGIDPWWSSRRDALSQASEQGAVVWLSAAGALSQFSDDSHLADTVKDMSVRSALNEVPGTLPERARTVGRSAARGMVPEAVQRPARAVEAYVRGPLRDADWYTNSFRLWSMKSGAGIPVPTQLGSHSARGLYRKAREVELAFQVERATKTGASVGLEVAFPFLDPELIMLLMSIPGTKRAPGGDATALLPVSPGPGLPDAASELVLEGWSDLRRRVLRVGVAARTGYVDGTMLEAELRFLRADIEEGQRDTASRVLDLLGLELFLEHLTAE